MEEIDNKNQIKETKQKLLLAESELKNFKNENNNLAITLIAMSLAFLFLKGPTTFATDKDSIYILMGIGGAIGFYGLILLASNTKSNKSKKDELEKAILLLKTQMIELEN